MIDQGTVEAALADAHRREWASVVASTVRVVRDLGVAEECVQEAYAAALQNWARDGIPASPAAWLTTAAKRRAIDTIRREQTFKAKLPLLVEPEEAVEDLVMAARHVSGHPAEPVVDERLKLMFLCCHPALAQEARVALTLRLVCGLATPDIARAFLVPETTMAARLTRAKKKIAGSRIPFRMPDPTDLPGRLGAVLGVVYLLFTTGHAAPSGTALVRTELVDTALGLARMLRDLMPDEPEVAGLLALLLATDARRPTRLSDDGELLRLNEQDRSRWNRAAIAEAHHLVLTALPDRRANRYALQAAIACLHAEAPTQADTDWRQILGLYDALLVIWPSPVVVLNRAVALAETVGPAAALIEVEALERSGQLQQYHYLPAVKADLLRRLGCTTAAVLAYERAREMAGNTTERRFLDQQIALLTRDRDGRGRSPDFRSG